MSVASHFSCVLYFGTREVSKDLIQTLHKDMVGVMGRLDKIISLLDSAEVMVCLEDFPSKSKLFLLSLKRDKFKEEKQEIDACDTPERG